MRTILFFITLNFIMFLFLGNRAHALATYTNWPVQSIDTMKYSRDLAREKLRDPNFQLVVDEQMQRIAESGATHVAIGTPYDKEFRPFLTLWVETARRHKVSVWFRGNFSGWEGWFGYPAISRVEHRAKTLQFIEENSALFQNGDIFTSCPECENGGPGDPRENGDVKGHREFLTTEYEVMRDAFQKAGVTVHANYFSMNADVAKLVMDEETTKKLDNIVVIDHYVSDPMQLARDVSYFAQMTHAKVVLGEFGAPIPAIHGAMTKEEQSEWLESALLALSQTEGVYGVNYWVNARSTTALWSPEGEAYPAQQILSDFYRGTVISGHVFGEKGRPVKSATLSGLDRQWQVAQDGSFQLPYFPGKEDFLVQAPGHETTIVSLSYENGTKTISLAKDPTAIGGLWGFIPFLKQIIESVIRFFSELSFTFSFP